MNLESVCLNEELKVIDGKAYAVISQLGRKRPVNGCQARIMIRLENTSLEGEKKALTQRLSEINNKLIANKQLDGALASAGYCLIDNPIYKKVDGIVIKDKKGEPIVVGTSHADECSHKEG